MTKEQREMLILLETAIPMTTDEQLNMVYELAKPDGQPTIYPGRLDNETKIGKAHYAPRRNFDEYGLPILPFCDYCGTLPGNSANCKNCGAPT